MSIEEIAERKGGRVRKFRPLGLPPSEEWTVVDFPRWAGTSQGASVAFKCNETCEAEGEIPVFPVETEEKAAALLGEIEEFLDSNVGRGACKVIDVHKHEFRMGPERHYHIECQNLTREQVRKLVEAVSLLG